MPVNELDLKVASYSFVCKRCLAQSVYWPKMIERVFELRCPECRTLFGTVTWCAGMLLVPGDAVVGTIPEPIELEAP